MTWRTTPGDTLPCRGIASTCKPSGEPHTLCGPRSRSSCHPDPSRNFSTSRCFTSLTMRIDYPPWSVKSRGASQFVAAAQRGRRPPHADAAWSPRRVRSKAGTSRTKTAALAKRYRFTQPSQFDDPGHQKRGVPTLLLLSAQRSATTSSAVDTTTESDRGDDQVEIPAQPTRKPISSYLAPHLAPIFSGTSRICSVARDAVLSAVKKRGIAGTGTPIADLAGVVADCAARARLGNGPLSTGGHGIAGGNRVLAVVTTAPTVLVAAGVVAVFVRDLRVASQAERAAPDGRAQLPARVERHQQRRDVSTAARATPAVTKRTNRTEVRPT